MDSHHPRHVFAFCDTQQVSTVRLARSVHAWTLWRNCQLFDNVRVLHSVVIYLSTTVQVVFKAKKSQVGDVATSNRLDKYILNRYNERQETLLVLYVMWCIYIIWDVVGEASNFAYRQGLFLFLGSIIAHTTNSVNIFITYISIVNKPMIIIIIIFTQKPEVISGFCFFL